MFTRLLIRCFIRHPEDTTSPQARGAYGRLAGVAGLCCNALLFLFKLLAGLLSGSVAVTADAFNNLSDAGSVVVTLVGFRLAAAPADKEHPFGHGRIEYLSAMGVAVLIVVAGFELARDALDKILHPVQAQFSLLTAVILCVSILVKLWMAVFYRKIGRAVSSEALLASSIDSRNDTICTALVLLCTVIGQFLPFAIDGFVGMAVALFVMWSGFGVIRGAVGPLLGQRPDPALVEGIRDTVLSHEGVLGVHDLMVHDYGPGRVIASLHAEVPQRQDILVSHEIVDEIERELLRKYNIVSCIHMDPVDDRDPRLRRLREQTEQILHELDGRLTLHDLRLVPGAAHTNLIFDIVVPCDMKDTDTLVDTVRQRLREIDPTLDAAIKLEHRYT